MCRIAMQKKVCVLVPSLNLYATKKGDVPYGSGRKYTQIEPVINVSDSFTCILQKYTQKKLSSHSISTEKKNVRFQ